MGKTANIAIVDDDEDVREGLTALFSSVSLTSDSYEGSDAFFSAFDFDQPGCVLMDVRLLGENGLNVFRRINEEYPDLPVIMISGHADVPMAVVAMRDGAFDFFEKPFSPKSVIQRVRDAISESRERRSNSIRRLSQSERFETLTSREREVLKLLLKNNANKQIAAILKLSDKTIEYHRANLMKKLKVSNVVGLVKLSMDAGWN